MYLAHLWLKVIISFICIVGQLLGLMPRALGIKSHLTQTQIVQQPIEQKCINENIRALLDQPNDLNPTSFKSIADCGPQAVPALMAILEGEDSDLTRHAAQALVNIGSDALPGMIEALQENTLVIGDRDASCDTTAAYTNIFSCWADNDLLVQTTVVALVKNLQDENITVRNGAVQALGAIGPSAYAAVPVMIETLQDGDELVRENAVITLGQIGPEARDAVPELIEVFQTQDLDLSVHAANALGQIGPDARDAVPAIITVLEDQDSDIRAIAAEVLGEIGPDAHAAVPALIAALSDQNVFLRRRAASALGEIGPDARNAVPALINALQDSDDGVQSNAMTALGNIGPAAEAAVSALIAAEATSALSQIGPAAIAELIKSLESDDITIRRNAAFILGEIGPEAQAAIPALTKTLQGEDAKLRGLSLFILATLSTDESRVIDGSSIVPELRDMSRDNNADLRILALYALGEISDSQALADALVEAFKSDDVDILLTAVDVMSYTDPAVLMAHPSVVTAFQAALPSLLDNEFLTFEFRQNLTSIGAPAVPTLVELLRDKNELVARNAATALGEIGSDARTAVPVLINLLRDETSNMQNYAAIALGDIGPDAQAAVPALTQLLQHEDSNLRSSAAAALGHIDPAAHTAIPALIELLERESLYSVQSPAAYALGNIGPAAYAAIPVLLEVSLSHESPYALAKIGPTAVPALIEALDSSNMDQRKTAASALARIGPDAKAAVPKLLELLENEDGSLRWRVTNALGQIIPQEQAAIAALMQVLQEEEDGCCSPSTQEYAAYALRRIGPSAFLAVIKTLQDGDTSARYGATQAFQPLEISSTTSGSRQFRKRVRQVLNRIRGN
ncbi:HEAT repeat-containing protein [Leptolyngbya sp. PCC 7375]|nr:HEAT repeat-containing protein [Leptolyngbya sp. PCC 7375]